MLVLYIKVFFFYLKTHFILLILKDTKIISWPLEVLWALGTEPTVPNRCEP